MFRRFHGSHHRLWERRWVAVVLEKRPALLRRRQVLESSTRHLLSYSINISERTVTDREDPSRATVPLGAEVGKRQPPKGWCPYCVTCQGYLRLLRSHKAPRRPPFVCRRVS